MLPSLIAKHRLLRAVPQGLVLSLLGLARRQLLTLNPLLLNGVEKRTSENIIDVEESSQKQSTPPPAANTPSQLKRVHSKTFGYSDLLQDYPADAPPFSL